MSSDKGSPSDASSQSGTRRPARTINLAADEIASSPVAESSSPEQQSVGEADSPMPRQVSVEKSSTQSDQTASNTSAQAEQPTPAAETMLRMEADASASEPPPRDPEPTTRSRDSSVDRRHSFWRMLGAGAVGAMLALLAFSVLAPWLSREQGASGLQSRLAQVEQQLGKMADRPATAGVDPKAIGDLTARLARLETVIATRAPPPDTALTNRIATLEGELRSIEERIGVVARRGDEIATIAADARSRA